MGESYRCVRGRRRVVELKNEWCRLQASGVTGVGWERVRKTGDEQRRSGVGGMG